MDVSHRSSVYDLSALRLHPDGSKVHQTSDNLTLGKHNNVAHVPRRGWIAKDAGGPCEPPLYKAGKKRRLHDDGGDLSDDRADEAEHAEYEDSQNVELERKCRKRNRRSKRRREFREDDSYISSHIQGTCNPLDQPSPDLLKNIHYHSSIYYKKQGVLSNETRRSCRRANKGRPSQHNSPSHSDEEVDHAAEDNHSNEEQDEHEKECIELSSNPARAQQNMYRAFEGSLLLGLGVLTQEMASELLGCLTPQKSNEITKTEDVDFEAEQSVTESLSGDNQVATSVSEGKRRLDNNKKGTRATDVGGWNGFLDVKEEEEEKKEFRDGPPVGADGKEEKVVIDIRDYWTGICEEEDEGTAESTESEVDEIDSGEW